MRFFRTVAAVTFALLTGFTLLLTPDARAAAAGAAATFVVQCGLEEGTTWQIGRGDYLTANHVVAGCDHVLIVTDAGLRDATVVRRNVAYDLAEVHSAYVAPESLALGNFVFRSGSRLTIRSAPGGTLVTTRGMLLSTSIVDGIPVLLTNARVSPGSSGGAVLDANGRVVALVQKMLLDGTHITLAIRQPYLHDFVTGALRGTRVGPAAGGAVVLTHSTPLLLVMSSLLVALVAVLWPLSIYRVRLRHSTKAALRK
jgi:S1-C subfamily serine protease